ncbi:MAG: sugar porter family MFS transporter [Verrucomicrobiota bacterium]
MAIITTTAPGGEDPIAPAAHHGSYLWLIAATAALGGLLFGYDWVVIGGAAPFYEKFFSLANASDKGWAQSCALIGCLVGALMSGGLSDRFGRKRLLFLSALIFAVSSIGTGMAGSFDGFVVWRMLGGVAIGLASNLSPMYIAEISPSAMRGRLVSLNQFTIVIGVLLAQVVNLVIAKQFPHWMGWVTAPDGLLAWNEASGWRWMFGVTAIPSVMFLLGMLVVPESPRWLVKNGHSEKASRILAKIGGEEYASHVLASIESTLKNDMDGKVHFGALFERRTFKILMLGIGLAVFQQWCGINVIFNYAGEIFKSAGYSIDDTLKNIAWTGSVNLVFTVVAMAVVDKLGRRPLMLFGAAGLAVIYALVGYCYHRSILGGPVLGLVLGAIGCYAATLAPVTWVVISEIFPNRIRGAAMSTSVFFLWLACFILTYTFPILNEKFGAGNTFWTYALICVGGFLMVLFGLPETKGKSLEQIERELVD